MEPCTPNFSPRRVLFQLTCLAADKWPIASALNAVPSWVCESRDLASSFWADSVRIINAFCKEYRKKMPQNKIDIWLDGAGKFYMICAFCHDARMEMAVARELWKQLWKSKSQLIIEFGNREKAEPGELLRCKEEENIVGNSTPRSNWGNI